MLSQVQSSHEPSQTPPEYQKLSGVEKVIAGTIATRGRRSTAASHCTAPGRTVRRCRPAVRPRLARGPFDGVVAVAALLRVGLELAVGAIAAAHVLNDDRVAAGARGLADESAVRSAVVGRAVDQGRKPSLRGTPYVGAQHDAVAHRHGDGGVHLNRGLS